MNTDPIVAAIEGCAKIHLLNTTILPVPGRWECRVTSQEEVAEAMFYYGSQGQHAWLESHIGHEATASVASELLGDKIAVCRVPWDGSGLGLALQLKGRIAEGAILSRQEMERIGYEWRWLLRLRSLGGGDHAIIDRLLRATEGAGALVGVTEFDLDNAIMAALGVPHWREFPGEVAARCRAALLKANTEEGFIVVPAAETRSGKFVEVRIYSRDLLREHTGDCLGVLRDPRGRRAGTPGGGYCGSAGHGTRILLYGEEDFAAQVKILAEQLSAAVGEEIVLHPAG